MTRVPAPDTRPVTLTIAGSDSGGGAGIQADLKSMEATGSFGITAITAVTAQNTTGVEASHVLPLPIIQAQLDAVLTDYDVKAAKTGMLATTEVIRLVTEYAAEFEPPLIVDPVMVAATGDRLLEPAAEAAYEDLIQHATLVTPNADEATVLTDTEVTDQDTAIEAGHKLTDIGATAALVKGGHVPGDHVQDTLVGPDKVEIFSHPRIDTNATHGSGCTLASTITSHLAQGDSVHHAVEKGVTFMERAVRYHLDVGEGPGAVHHLAALRNNAAQNPTAETVHTIVQELVAAAVRPLIPEVGMNVVGATPYAEAPSETAAVEGRITRTLDGIQPNRGIRYGASSHLARFLLACRERKAGLRYAVNCRFNEVIEKTFGDLDAAILEFDRENEPEPEVEGGTMTWAAREVIDSNVEPPIVVFDRGAVGKEPITRVVASSREELLEPVLTLNEIVDN